jgi:hypothetical protein
LGLAAAPGAVGDRVGTAATIILPLAVIAQVLSAAGYGLSKPGGRTVDWWARSLMVACAAIAAACVILTVSLLGWSGPSSCAPLSSAGARWMTAGVAISLLTLGVLSVQAARLVALTGRGGTLAAVLGAEAVAGALAIVLFLGLAGGTSC